MPHVVRSPGFFLRRHILLWLGALSLLGTLTLWTVPGLPAASRLQLVGDLPWQMHLDPQGRRPTGLGLPGDDFLPMEGPLTPGKFDGVIWLRFKVPPQWHEGEELWLRVTPATLESVQLFRSVDEEAAGKGHVSENGDVLRHDGHMFDHGQLLFRLRPDERGTALLRVRDEGLSPVEAELGTPASFIAERRLVAYRQLGWASAALAALFLLTWCGQVLHRRVLHKTLAVEKRIRQRLHDRNDLLIRTERALRLALDAEHRLLLEQRHFFAMVNHEFKTPLAIVEQVTTMQERFPTPEPSTQVERALHIRRAARRIGSLVDNCLADERLSAGGFVLQLQDIEAAALVRAACELVILSSRHYMQIDTAGAPARWEADPVLLRIAVSNLVDNAARHARQGCIRVVVAEIGEELFITVGDDGPGIPPADRERIFKAFEQGRSGERGGDGHGFGLYVARKIARLHGGEATVVNSYFGGTIFHLRIPHPARKGASAPA